MFDKEFLVVLEFEVGRFFDFDLYIKGVFIIKVYIFRKYKENW